MSEPSISQGCVAAIGISSSCCFAVWLCWHTLHFLTMLSMSAFIPYTNTRYRVLAVEMCWCLDVQCVSSSKPPPSWVWWHGFLSEEHHWGQRSRLWSSRTALCVLDIDLCTVAIHLSQYWLTLGVFHRVLSCLWFSRVSIRKHQRFRELSRWCREFHHHEWVDVRVPLQWVYPFLTYNSRWSRISV